MWQCETFDLGYINPASVIFWLNEIQALEAHFVARGNGVFVVFARVPDAKPIETVKPVVSKAKRTVKQVKQVVAK